MSSPVTYEQFDFVEKLLEDWARAEACNEAYVGCGPEEIAARRAEFNRLFMSEDE